MRKKGLSSVITSLIIILLILAAIGIIWIVIRNTLESGSDEIFLGKFTVDLTIKTLSADFDANSISVRVKRNVGEGNLAGVRFLFSDGTKTEEFEEEVSLKEIEEAVFEFNLTQLNVSKVESVSIAPIFETESGRKVTGEVLDTYLVKTSGTSEGFPGEDGSENFLTRVYLPNSTGNSAWYGYDESVPGIPPPPDSFLMSSETEYSNSSKNIISSDDENFTRAVGFSPGPEYDAEGNKIPRPNPGHRIKFNIQESPEEIAGIEITAKGYGSDLYSNYKNFSLYIWNNSSLFWENATSWGSGVSKGTLDFEIESGFESYVMNGEFYILLMTRFTEGELDNYADLYYAEVRIIYSYSTRH